MRFTNIVLSFCLSLALATVAQAQTAPTLAEDGLQPRIDHLSQDPQANRFELGFLLTLRGVEKTLQARYDHGLGQQMTTLPLLRLRPILAPNPAPRRAGPDTLSRIMTEFVIDMERARDALIAAEQNGVTAFELALPDLWFDINGNGTRDEGESAIETLGTVVLGPRAYGQFRRDNVTVGTDFLGKPVSESFSTELVVRFDTADQAWLTAYTHMLSGFGNLFLAFDPEPILRDLDAARALLNAAPTIPNFYDQADLIAEIDALEQELETLQARDEDIRAGLEQLNQQSSALVAELNQAETQADKDTLQSEIQSVREKISDLRTEQRDVRQARGLVRNEIRSAQAKQTADDATPLQSLMQRERATIDTFYVALAAIQQQPDPARIRAAHADWTAMIRHNRQFWDLLAQETDNDREWIPNARQSSVLPVEIPERVAEGWQNILADAEAVLDGRLLIPHPLLPPGHGISLPAYVENPAPLDLTRWVHGVGAYPYAAKGPRITAQSWQAFERLTSGNAAGFALFFN